MLNQEQLGFFKDNGYLIVPGLLDKELCGKVSDMMWSSLPTSSSIKKSDINSHVGPFLQEDISEDSIHYRSGYRWLNRALGSSSEVIDLIYSDAVLSIAQQLLGGQLRQIVREGKPMGTEGPVWPGGPTDPATGTQAARGVYCTLPYGDKPREPDQCHTDGHPFQLGIVGLIDDSPADGGAFKVWPKSHKTLYPTFHLRYDQPRIPYYDHLPSFKGILHTQAYRDEISRLNEEVTPVECWGAAGDAVFWHHRTAHMAGHNYTSVTRQAVLADFWTEDLDKFRAKPATGDMWQDWAACVQESTGEYSEEFALAQRLAGARTKREI